MHVNAKLSWQHAVLSALVMSSAVSANYGSVHVRRGEHAVRDILPNSNAHALRERDLLSTLSDLFGGAGAGAGNNDDAGEAAAGGQDENAQDEAAQDEAAQGDAAQADDAEADDAESEDAEGQGQDEGAAAGGEADSKFQNPTDALLAFLCSKTGS